MAYSFTASSSMNITASPPVTGMPLTIAAWAYPNSTTTVPARGIVNIGNTNANNGSNGSFRIIIPSNVSYVRAAQIIHGGGSATVDTASGAVSANQWIHMAAVFASTSSRSVYASTASSVTSTTLFTTTTTVNNIAIGCLYNPTASSFFDGIIADVGVWSAALTSDEISSLAKGISCTKIRPQSLVFCVPLVRDLNDICGNLSLTNNNSATVTSHPRIYY